VPYSGFIQDYKEVMMKVLTRSILASSIALALLSGCGGSDNENDPIIDDGHDTATKTISVIDGYLENADVYVDRNSNGTADTDEKLDKKTDAKGQIEILLTDAKFDLIAQINSDTTKDSDGTGTTGRSYQMIAKAGLDFITPFTTIAKIQNKTLEVVASDLNIDESVIAGDYIAQKEATETSEVALKAHAFARNLTTTFSEKVAENNKANISRYIDTIKVDIDQAINADVDLDTIISQVVTLEDILVGGKTFYSVAVNANTNSKEDVTTVQFLADGKYEGSNDNGPFSGDFTVDGNTVTYTDEDGDEEGAGSPVYISKSNYISVSESGILDVLSSTIDIQAISQSMFTGTTWYQLFDDGVSSTQPCFVKVEFTTGAEMKYVEAGDCGLPDLRSDAYTEYPYHWKIVNNELSIYDDKEGVTGGEAKFIVTSNSERLVVVKDTYKGKRSVFLKDKALAASVFAKWNDKL
jgi:hypoxanthine-guanine phosphoribosyltransferase